jgi:hypothetical protein
VPMRMSPPPLSTVILSADAELIRTVSARL